MITTLERYNQAYNRQIVQQNLGYLTPVKAMKQGYKKKPEIFKKRVYDRVGLDKTFAAYESHISPPILQHPKNVRWHTLIRNGTPPCR